MISGLFESFVGRPWTHTRAYPFSLSLFTSFILYRVLQHLTQIPHFWYSPRSYLFRYSPRSYLFRYSPRFYLPGTRPNPTISVLARILPFPVLVRISPIPGTRPDPTFPVLAWIPHFRYSPEFLSSQYSPRSHLSGTRPNFYFFGTCPDPTFSGTHPDFTFPVLARIPHFRYSPGFYLSCTRPYPTFSILAQILPFLGTCCHAPDPDPTRLADPNRFSGRETQDWDSLPDFFFKQNWYLWVWPTSYNIIKISYTFIESHLQIQN